MLGARWRHICALGICVVLGVIPAALQSNRLAAGMWASRARSAKSDTTFDLACRRLIEVGPAGVSRLAPVVDESDDARVARVIAVIHDVARDRGRVSLGLALIASSSERLRAIGSSLLAPLDRERTGLDEICGLTRSRDLVARTIAIEALFEAIRERNVDEADGDAPWRVEAFFVLVEAERRAASDEALDGPVRNAARGFLSELRPEWKDLAAVDRDLLRRDRQELFDSIRAAHPGTARYHDFFARAWLPK